MRCVVFVAPFFLETTLRFLEATLDLEGTRVGLVSQEPLERLPARLREKLTCHFRVDDCLKTPEILRAARALGEGLGSVDVVMGVLEHLQVQLAEVRAELGVAGLSVDGARNFRDKARMKSVLRKAGLPCASHCLASSAPEARAFAAEYGYPLVVKPPAGAGAKGTHRIDRDSDLEQALALYRPRAGAEMLLEEFVSGSEYSFDSVVVGGKPVWHSFSSYMPTPLEVIENDWIQWCVFMPREIDTPEFERFREIGFRAVRTLGLETGLSHMEWFDRGERGMAVSEVGARPPGAGITTLLSYVHDFDVYRAWARLMVFGEFEAQERKYAAGAAYLRAQGRGRVKDVRGLEQAQRELGDLVIEAHLPRKGQPAGDGYEGQGIVFLRHRESSVVKEGLQRLVQLVQVDAG